MEVVRKMEFGIVLPTFLYSAERKVMAERSYASLARTEVPEVDRPLRVFVVAANSDSADVALNGFSQFFDVLTGTKCWPLKDNAAMSMKVWLQREGIQGTDQSLCQGVEVLMEAAPDVTHFIYLTDDLLYNPRWFVELKALVERHPTARAWSVYRSAHEKHHKTWRREGDDHLVSSLSGNGTCMTIEEWKGWGVSCADGCSWPVPSGGNTLDLHHAYYRQGERWATDVSMIQHDGRLGLRCNSSVPEYALNFIGEQP